MSRASELTRDTGWNMLGIGIPLVAAIFAIPPLVHGLGTERFGILTIGWVIMGYFALFDFGMGLATTRFVAAHIAASAASRIPAIVWSSFVAHVVLGGAGGAVFASLVPWLSGETFKFQAEMRPEVTTAFYLLAISVPLVVCATCLRGTLEGTRRFDLVNKVKIPVGILNYVGPLLVLQFTTDLPLVIGVIVLGRGIALVIYFALCMRVLPQLGSRFEVDIEVIRPLLRFSGWVAASGLILPLIALLDRLVIGAVVSISAVAYYATPYEIVTKLWIFSASLLAAMFPVFTALSVENARELRPLGIRALKLLLVMTAPAVAVLLVFSDALLTVWIGPDFALYGAPVARWMALGTLLSVLAQAPLSVLLGLGRADIAAKLQIGELIIYAFAAYYLAQRAGITGVAIAWMLRAGIELALFMFVTDKLLKSGTAEPVRWLKPSTIFVMSVMLGMFWFLGAMPADAMGSRLAIFCLLFVVLLGFEWFFVFDAEDRETFFGILSRIRTTD